jgi:hypothetical protein
LSCIGVSADGETGLEGDGVKEAMSFKAGGTGGVVPKWDG